HVEDDSVPNAVRESDRLHARVQAFAKGYSTPRHAPPAGLEPFEQLALDIARFQYEMSASFALAIAISTGNLSEFDDFTPLPTDAFRYGRVALHPPDLDAATFRTSGTTSEPGRHFYRILSTKEKLSLLQARTTLFKDIRRAVVIAIAEPPGAPPSSSLGHL